MENQFPDILNEMLNHAHKWHPSDQNVSRSTLSWNGKPNYNSRRLNNRVQMLQPPEPKEHTTMYKRVHFIMGKTLSIPHLKQLSSVLTTLNPETKLIKWHKTADMLITLWYFKQQMYHVIAKVCMVGDHFSSKSSFNNNFLVSTMS